MEIIFRHKFLSCLIILMGCLTSSSFNQFYAQVLLNNGANINAIGGAYIHVNGSVENNIGTVNIEAVGGVPAELYVTEDVINNSDLIVEGHIRLLGDWYNNSTFTSRTLVLFSFKELIN